MQGGLVPHWTRAHALRNTALKASAPTDHTTPDHFSLPISNVPCKNLNYPSTNITIHIVLFMKNQTCETGQIFRFHLNLGIREPSIQISETPPPPLPALERDDFFAKLLETSL